MNNNVIAIPSSAMSSPRAPIAAAMDQKLSATLLRFDTQQDDKTVLVRAAPWLQQEIDPVDEWRRCLFMSRFSKHLDAAMGSPIAANIGWTVKCGEWARGKVATPAGNVIIELINSYCRGRAAFGGHRDALIYVGVARAAWLHTESRQGRRNSFQSNIFDAERTINVTRSGDRYRVMIDFTEEEGEGIDRERFRRLEEGKSAAESAVKSLPRSRSEFRQRFCWSASLAADLVQHHALLSEGGFCLDDTSRAAILTQLDIVRQAIQQVTVCFDRGERVSDIENIAQKHAPTAQGVPNSTT